MVIRGNWDHRRLSRRTFLGLGGMGIAALTFDPVEALSNNRKVVVNPKFPADPFSLGVASGDPLPNGVVLWTRLAPDPLNGGEMLDAAVPVRWRVATDENMRTVVREGTVLATPELAHSVHSEVGGLEPARWYWYQFQAGKERSPVGRTRTAPAFGSRSDQLAFAFVNCQDYQNGYYPAYRHMAEEDLDLVVHLGDYIYEYAYDPQATRPYPKKFGESMTLEEYRTRYAAYKMDPDLRAAHAAFPWAVILDDHEVSDNWADENSFDEDVPPQEFLDRRAAAFQAYYEHMPLRRSSMPSGSDMPLYRGFSYGDLAQLQLLDTRQYRSDQAEAEFIAPGVPGSLDADMTMTGADQERWLFNGLDRSQTVWNIIAQQTMMAEFDYDNGPYETINHDQWDGYKAARGRLLGFIQQRRPSNPVVISGDWHSSWVNDLKEDFGDPDSETLATEFVGTPISSACTWGPQIEVALPGNPHVRFFDGKLHGYVRCTLDRQLWRSDFRVVDSLEKREAPIRTLTSFVVENGRAGAVPA